ncbi:GPP34 family phosphoprotein [Streptomyces sp. ODS28]|uniref:GOLPH3/VPS74 family protein n=1 Tax=Streptomyces sp. ODS28 TaxID=3136688 RepID=UPI0031EBBE87
MRVTDRNGSTGDAMNDAYAHQGADGSALTLSEELLLLGIDPARGKPAVERRYLRWGLVGAGLVELEAAGRVAEDRSKVVVTQPSPTGVPHLDGALDELQQHKGRMRTQWWLDYWGRRVEPYVARSLEARGAVRAETHRVMGMFPSQRYTVLDPQACKQRLAALHDWAAHPPADRHTAALFALVKATKLARKLDVPREARREMRSLVESFWQAKAVRKKVRAAQSSGGAGGGDGGGGGGCGGGGGG